MFFWADYSHLYLFPYYRLLVEDYYVLVPVRVLNDCHLLCACTSVSTNSPPFLYGSDRRETLFMILL